MRKVIVSNVMSVDGYFESRGGSLDWFTPDAEFHQYAAQMLADAGCILFGRVTYQMMAAYWPTQAGLEDDPVIAAGMNGLSKIVFSNTLRVAEWQNTTIAQSTIAGTIARLKAEPGKNIMLLGSGSILAELTKLNLIDEYRLIISPVILGTGTPNFSGNPPQINLKLSAAKPLSSGVVILTYTRQ